MKPLSHHLVRTKNLLDAQLDFLGEVREIIHQISGVDLAADEMIWRVPALTIKASPPARNLIFRHREKILTAFADRFNRRAPRFIG